MKRTTTREASSGPSRCNRSRRQREGFFLVLVLIVIVVATMAVYSFTDLMVAYDSPFLAGMDALGWTAATNDTGGVDGIDFTL